MRQLLATPPRTAATWSPGQAARGELISSTIEVGIAAGITLLALALRLPRLHDLPRYTDEVNEVLISLRIFQGKAHPLPLASASTYIGAFWDYVVAGAFAVFGLSPELPRLLVMAAGVLTVGMAYLLGRELGGPRAGALAALLLAVSSAHILLSSHVAWSACPAPLFVVTAAWAVQRAANRHTPAWLLLAGPMAGLALQAHPATLAPLVGCALLLLVADRRALRTPWPYLALLLAAASYGNMILYNLRTSLGSVRSVENISPAAEEITRPRGLSALPENLANLADGLARATASVVDGQLDVFGIARAALVAALILVALISLARNGRPLPLLALVSSLVLMPWLNGSYTDILDMRYTMPLVALLLAGVAAWVSDQFAIPAGPRRLPRWTAPGLALLLLVAIPPVDLVRLYAAADQAGCTNEPQRQWVAEIQRLQRPGEPLVQDEALVRPGPRLATYYLYKTSGREADRETISREFVAQATRGGRSFLTVLDDGSVSYFSQRTGLAVDMNGATPAERGIGLYRVTAQGATRLSGVVRPDCDRWGRA